MLKQSEYHYEIWAVLADGSGEEQHGQFWIRDFKLDERRISAQFRPLAPYIEISIEPLIEALQETPDDPPYEVQVSFPHVPEAYLALRLAESPAEPPAEA